MSSAEQQPTPEKKKSSFLRSLGKVALVAAGLVIGANILEHTRFFHHIEHDLSKASKRK